jgi:hypothetical protein
VISGVVTESCLYYYLVGQVNYSLLPGESQTFAVRYMPEGLGTHVCTIDTGSPCDEGIICVGTLASSAALAMDVFTQDAGGSVRVGYTLVEPGPVRISVYDAAGRLVRALENTAKNAGRHYSMWDGKNQEGGRVNAGVYFIKMSYMEETLVKKAMIVR